MSEVVIEDFDWRKYVEENDRYTFVIINIHDGYTVDVFKSRNLTACNNGRGMYCEEGEMYGYVGSFKTEILPNGFKQTCYDDGHVDETYMFNLKNKEALMDAQKVLGDISNELKKIKKELDIYTNFLWCEWCDRGRIERRG